MAGLAPLQAYCYYLRSMRMFWCFVFLILVSRLPAQESFEQIAEQEMKSKGNDLKSLSTNAVSNTNIIYDRLELNIDPAVDYISGKVITCFIPDTAISFLEFDLTDTLHADSVLYHGQQISFTHTNDILHISLPGTIAAGLVDSVAIFYQGVPDSTGFGSFVRSTHGSDSVPVIWTLSEPYGARDWWPCKQDLTDKIDSIDLLITTPSTYKAASNGLLVEQLVNGNKTTYHWKHRYPIATYLVCLAVTNYQVFTNLVPYLGDTLSVLNYVYPEDFAADTSQANLTVSFMQLYDSLFGLYPFSKEKYGQVEFNWKGGMEHQTMTFMYNYGFELVAHELAHHWFGDKVTCGSWHDIWLNEGFAVYLTTLCYRFRNTNYWYMASKQGSIVSGTDSAHGSVWCDDTTRVSRIFDAHLSYAKGSVVLHQLDWILGDSIFFGGLRSYLADTGDAFGFGTTAGLKKHLELSSGLDLTNYFDQYVYGRGHPTFQLQWSQDFSKRVTLTVGQTPSDVSVPFFQIPVPIQFKNATTDTLIIFNPSASGQTYSFELPFLADTLILDPNFDILSRNNTVTRLVSGNFICLVYPNPASGIVNVQLQSSQSGKADIKIYDLQGRAVWSGANALEAGANFFSINISSLSAGRYELSARNGKQVATSSFVVIDQVKH